MAKKENGFSLQLTLNFNNAPAGLKTIVEQLATLADGVSTKGSTQLDLDIGDTKTTSVKDRQDRIQLNRLVSIAAHARGVSIGVMWIILYHHIGKATGRHPVAEATRLGLTCYLDALLKRPASVKEAKAYLANQIEKFSNTLDV